MRVELPEKPLALLGIGQRQRPVTPDRQQGGRLVERTLRNPFGELGQVVGLEQRTQRQLDLQPLAHPGYDLGGDQRMAAQLEEMIAPPDPVDVQDLAPDLRQGRFQLALGGLVLAGSRRFQASRPVPAR